MTNAYSTMNQINMNQIKTKACYALATLLITSISVIGPGSAFGQQTIGFRLGANVANETWNSPSNAPSQTSLTSIMLGIQTDYWIADMLAFEVQLLYDQKGTNTIYNGDFSNVQFNGTGEVRASYLEIPILLKFRLPTPLLKPYVFAGPSIGVLLSSSNTSSGITSSGQPVSSNKSDALNSTDISALVGVGLELHITDNLNAFVDVGQAFGLQDVNKNVSVDPITNANVQTVKSKDLRVLAGIVLPL